MQSDTAQKTTAKNEKRPFSKLKRSNFVSLRGAQRRGNLKVRGTASRGEAREWETKRNPYHKNMDSQRRSAFPLFTPRFCFVPPYHSSLRDGESFRLRLPRRAQKCALLAMTNLVGFAEKRSSFWNETFEKRCGAAPRKNDFIKQKTRVSPT